MRRLTLCHLYPREMNIYGDRGNVIVLKRRAEWRGIECHVREVSVGDRVDPSECDLLFGGGGQDDQQVAVGEDLRSRQADTLRGLAADGVPMLTVCGTYQLFGHYFRTRAGQEIRGIGIFDAITVAGEVRWIGDTLVESSIDGRPRSLIGFENHSGETVLPTNGECHPLARVIIGAGNNGRDGGEGAVWRHVLGTYLHGPILPKNPWLADYVLGRALERVGHREELAPLDDRVENAAHDSVVARLRRRGRRNSGLG
ncbi:MAG: glutamine amidotransferase [Chloroflexota bacterium]|nr:MAG: glutamine amidotransferase [Chloroflexota bacterium]